MLNNTPRYRHRNTCEVTTTSTADLTVAATPYATKYPRNLVRGTHPRAQQQCIAYVPTYEHRSQETVQARFDSARKRKPESALSTPWFNHEDPYPASTVLKLSG